MEKHVKCELSIAETTVGLAPGRFLAWNPRAASQNSANYGSDDTTVQWNDGGRSPYDFTRFFVQDVCHRCDRGHEVHGSCYQ